jgi:hypothetical protein
MYIPFCVRLATQALCARGLRPPIAQPRVRLAVIVCHGILFTPTVGWPVTSDRSMSVARRRMGRYSDGSSSRHGKALYL